MKIVLDKGSGALKDAIMPVRAHPEDAGLDLFSREDKTIPARSTAVFDTGVHFQIEPGYVGDVKSKSSLMLKGITTDGTVDCGYTGSVKVILYNHSPFNYDVKAGQKIAQLVVKKIVTPELEVVESLEETERGSGGFGSTGKF